MSAFAALLRREVHALLVAPFVYLLLALWFLLNALLFGLLLGFPDVQNDLSLLPQVFFGNSLLLWLLLPVFPPLLTLRLLAEEHRLGTLETLLTSPISDAAVVLAKYLAAGVFFLLFWGGVLFLFVLIALHGALLDAGAVAGGLLGVLACSLLFLAAGLWASSWGGNLVLAAGGGAAINYALLFLPGFFHNAPGGLGRLAKSISIPTMLETGFAAGLIDSFALAYLLLMAALFLFLTWVRLVSRRWVP